MCLIGIGTYHNYLSLAVIFFLVFIYFVANTVDDSMLCSTVLLRSSAGNRFISNGTPCTCGPSPNFRPLSLLLYRAIQESLGTRKNTHMLMVILRLQQVASIVRGYTVT